MYIRQLNEGTQKRIEKDLRDVLMNEGLTDEQELKVVIENGLDSKISDIAHILNVDTYIKEDTVISCLEYMQRMDHNGSWDDAVTDIWMGEPIEDNDINYMIDVLKEWHSDLQDDNDKVAERMKNDMNGWIERLENVQKGSFKK